MQKICKAKVCAIKFFPTILGKFRQNILHTPKQLSAPTPMTLELLNMVHETNFKSTIACYKSREIFVEISFLWTNLPS